MLKMKKKSKNFEKNLKKSNLNNFFQKNINFVIRTLENTQVPILSLKY